MELTRDELAGVVDLFGGLTRAELDRAIAELAFRHGEEPPEEPGVEDALDAYALVAVDAGERVLVPGPTAFPALPDHAVDLPHILDAEARDIDPETAGRAARERLRADAERALDAGDDDRIERLLDVSYDVAAWTSVDVTETRDRLAAAVDGA